MKKKLEIPIQEITLLSKAKCNICIAYNCTIPKKCPQWLLDLWTNREKMWFEIEISFTEILELFNLGMDIMLSRNGETGNINIETELFQISLLGDKLEKISDDLEVINVLVSKNTNSELFSITETVLENTMKGILLQ